jgi:hypothetical protein
MNSSAKRSIKILCTLALMTVCGAFSLVIGISFLMNLGMKLHNNYEYYGSVPAVILCGAVGFATSGLLVWWLEKRGWKISLRALLITITVVSVLLAIYVWADAN